MDKYLFNSRDKRLLEHLSTCKQVRGKKQNDLLFNYHLHPRGIKELVNPKSIRVADLMRNLLDTLEDGQMEERLLALHTLRDEVFYSAQGSMGKNTARALLSVMKDLVREEEDERRLELASDFHRILTGKPQVVRKFLKQYHLLEMPEKWNQLAFDHHVHDAHTKGRKSPTHLIMDAWIKGIRSLTVIYYDYIPPQAAEELLKAAACMEIKVRIGVELTAHHEGTPVSFIWTPRGFSDAEGFLHFLDRKEVREFMGEGEKFCRKRTSYVYSALKEFNEKQLENFNRYYHIELPALDKEKFGEFVSAGLASMLHLSEFIHAQAFPLLKARSKVCTKLLEEAEGEEKERLQEIKNRANLCTPEHIVDSWLDNEDTAQIADQLTTDKEQISPLDLIKRLDAMRSGYRLTLNLTGLKAVDVLELVYTCGTRLNALEIYNQKDWTQGLCEEIPKIRSFQHPLNEGNTIALKRAVTALIEEEENTQNEQKKEGGDKQIKRLKSILKDLSDFIKIFENHTLADRWGSDSTGRSTQLFGMGLAVLETLPGRTQREILKKDRKRILDIHIPIKIRRTWTPRHSRGLMTKKTPFHDKSIIDGREWIAQEYSDNRKDLNNVIALGWRPLQKDNGFDTGLGIREKKHLSYRWHYMNNDLKNVLKIIIGFIPAFLTFALTKQWWILAYLGAPIWFGITGFRNILQSVIGGDGLRRSPLLSWNTYINWTRVSDSLFYTGFSVPLLDFLVKQMLLDKGMGINTSTNITALYGIMALVNGIYISSHNFFRGLPGGAIAGNFFRSILSIPLAIAFNSLLAGILELAGVPGTELILQKWAAVISKAASDCVAGVIEGSADSRRNIKLRYRDYERKIDQMYRSFVKMELLMPKKDVLQLSKDPKKLAKLVKIEDPDLLHTAIYDALDLLYFWYYQPHARTVFKHFVRRMAEDERLILLRFQHVLEREKLICNLFLNGALGKDFKKAMTFYMSHFDQYLLALEKMVKKQGKAKLSASSLNHKLF